MKLYDAEPIPGEWDHKALDCDAHGLNIPFARPKGSVVPHECVACLLEVAEIVRRQSEKQICE